MGEYYNSKLDYLLKYISMKAYQDIIKENNKYVISLYEDNAYDINLNIKYLVRYGVSDIESVIVNKAEDIAKNHNIFIKEIEEYEKYLKRNEIISLFENTN